MIDKPGIYDDVAAADYHADCCPAPSLSSSLAKTLLEYSPRHAWLEHPRLNSAYQHAHSEKFERGTAAHAYLLQGEAGFVLIDAPDFKTNAARAARDQARRDGKLPLLRHRWDEVLCMADEATRQLTEERRDRPRAFSGGRPERTLVWQEPSGIWCRARPDWLHDDYRVIDDYKTTEACAEPSQWSKRQFFSLGYDVQAAFYLRGLKAVTGRDARFRFVVQENYAPFALIVVEVPGDVLELANRKVRAALDLWRACLESNRWPCYSPETAYVDMPPWVATEWEQHALRLAPAVDDGRDLSDQLMGDPA